MALILESIFDSSPQPVKNAESIPGMFNPFTFEKVCKHTCKKCGKNYNLEFAYPRLVFLDNNGEEIPAFTR